MTNCELIVCMYFSVDVQCVNGLPHFQERKKNTVAAYDLFSKHNYMCTYSGIEMVVSSSWSCLPA